MEENKKAAKAFVDQYFPVKKQASKPTDIWAELFQSNHKKEFPIKEGCYGGGSNSLNSHGVIAGGKQNGNAKKGQIIPQKGEKSVEHCELSEPCLMSSSVDYGCRDNYPYSPRNPDNFQYNPDCRYPGPSYYIENKDEKEGLSYEISETQVGAEWWQGSFYY